MWFESETAVAAADIAVVTATDATVIAVVAAVAFIYSESHTGVFIHYTV